DSPRGRLRATPFFIVALCRHAPVRPRRSLGKRGSLTQHPRKAVSPSYLCGRRGAILCPAEVNFDTVFNGMFPPVNECVRSASRPQLEAPPRRQMQPVTKFIRRRNRTPQKAIL